MKSIQFLVIVLVVAGVFGAARAGAAERVISDSDIITLPGNVHPLARPEYDTGAAPSSFPMQRMILILRRSAEKQAQLDRFLAGLQDPSSPDFHRWLAPDEFGRRFGPSSEDINAITRWLASHGFVVEAVGRGKASINFSGTAGGVERAFHTSIHLYRVNGRLYHANAKDPSIPRGLADVVAGVASLNDFPRKPMHNGIQPVDQPNYTSGGSYYLSPGDFATIYDVNALYGAGISGSGQSIAIVGRTHPSGTEWATFRTLMGLPANPPTVIVNGPDPGDLGGDEDVEADLDVEWSGAVAQNASILFVTSQSTSTTDGVDLSAQYIVDNNLAPVMSTSFGECESDLGTSENQFYDGLWQQAAAQGITAFVSSGDSGAAGCNSASDARGSGKAVNGLASTPYNVAVGGTEFNEGSGTYWGGTNNGYTSALSYIPEVVWNQSGANGGSDLWSTGGGLSIEYTKPAWQVAPGVPSNDSRCVPDVALSAATHDAYLVETLGALYAVGGTSASSPSMAGLMALIVQKTGGRQGNVNTRFYQLGNSQYGAGGAVVFHNITSGNNSVPGVTGYTAGTGYSCTTGLGSVDAYALVTNWTPDFAIAASPNAFSIDQGSAGASTVQASLLGDFDSAVTLSASGLPTRVTAAFSPATIAAPGSGSSTMTITVGASSPAGTYPVTVTGTGGGTTNTTTVTLVIVQTYTVTSSVANGTGGTVTPGSATVATGGSVTLTVAPSTGYGLASLTDNGTNVTTAVSNGSYTITNITANHTVVATFAIDTYTITAVESGNGSITDSSGSVSYGGSVTFTITPAGGYTLSGLTDNGVAVTPTQGSSGTFTYTITDVTANQTVDATFSPLSATPVPAMDLWGFIGAACGMLWIAMKRRRKP
ncbi:MAG: protease pro-enzyme activation domain-containing protein [Syntrophorhabdales bacterium]